MSSNYQLKRNNPYYITDKTIYKLVGAILQAYSSLKKLPTGTPTNAIEGVLSEMTEKYKQTCTGEPFDAYGAYMDYRVFCYYRSNPKKDEAPSTRTWKRYRAEVIFLLARELKYL